MIFGAQVLWGWSREVGIEVHIDNWRIFVIVYLQKKSWFLGKCSYKGATCIDYYHLKVKRFINFNFRKQINRMGWSALPSFNLRHIEKIAYIKKLRHYDILNVL